MTNGVVRDWAELGMAAVSGIRVNATRSLERRFEGREVFEIEIMGDAFLPDAAVGESHCNSK